MMRGNVSGGEREREREKERERKRKGKRARTRVCERSVISMREGVRERE